MRQQTAPGALPAGGSPRLDPFALPVSYAVPSAGKLPGAAISATIRRDLVAVGRREGTISVPTRSFRGVAVRMTPTANGDRLVVLLELNHADPALSLPLLVADDPAEVAADWRAWSRSLGLPMLLVEPDGSLTRPTNALGAIEVALPKPRRMHSYFASRRPRFLARRKTGWQRALAARGGAEIIARD